MYNIYVIVMYNLLQNCEQSSESQKVQKYQLFQKEKIKYKKFSIKKYIWG